MTEAIHNTMLELAKAAKVGSRQLAVASTAKKNAVLFALAAKLRASTSLVLDANQKDLRAAETKISGAMLDRLRLDERRLEAVAEAVEQVQALPDPVGTVNRLHQAESGLQIGKMKIPLGLILMIYESRPNVTVDAAALCIKSGNGCILRGGSEAFETNRVLADLVQQALVSEGLPAEAVTLVPTTDRSATLALLGLHAVIDLAIPRGGEGLIRFVVENASIPVVQHYKGVCHVYVDGDASLSMAKDIVLNSKVQRPGVCNAMETLLVDAACAQQFLPQVAEALQNAQVELRGDDRVQKILGDRVQAATPEDWDTEYLDLILSVAVVDGLDGALRHIEKHGSNHTECIVTSSYEKSQRWLKEVDASFVAVNASTRFNDGGQLGLGAEIGISTTKMHAYGPMGLEELCAEKWIGYGAGQVRS